MDKRAIIKKKLRIFKNELKRDFLIDRIIFFGSRASGRHHRYSDIDLIIVSPKFRNLDFVERGAKMYDYWKLNYPVDFLCYTPKEFKRLSKQITIVSEAVKEGIEI